MNNLVFGEGNTDQPGIGNVRVIRSLWDAPKAIFV
jgi:hypothetical protein